MALALCVTAASSGGASAAVKALTDADAGAYSAAFQAASKGDFDAANEAADHVSDKSLLGYLQLQKLTWRGATATYSELKSWLGKYADLPGASRILQLARKHKPKGAVDLKAIGKTVEAENANLSGSPLKGLAAREAFYSGDVRGARRLAASSGERWVAGLSAFRLGDYADAMSRFQAVALDPTQGEWLRSGAAYWAARAAIASGSPELAPDFLRIASRSPWTFYGLLAERQLGLEAGADPQAFALAQAGLAPALPSPDGEIVRAAYSALSGPVLARLVKADIRAKRAVALAQIGRAQDAGLELRAGLASARTDAQRRLWTTLALELNPGLAQASTRKPKGFDPDDYPTPKLTPTGGFTIDKALVYAIVRQESRFDPNAVSGAGAIGLMQLMPQSAAQAAGDDKLLTDASPLYDPATNLRVGQDYVEWLLEKATGGDILRAVAAYNGGPGTLMRTQQSVGDGDALMLIESLPAAETRDYVEKVVAAYWVYRRMFGESARSIDTIASGGATLPAKLDR